MIRRVMQVEITTREDNSVLDPGQCHVSIRNPHNDELMAQFVYQDLERWTAGLPKNVT